MALFSQNRWLKITVRLALFFRASGSLVSEFTPLIGDLHPRVEPFEYTVSPEELREIYAHPLSATIPIKVAYTIIQRICDYTPDDRLDSEALKLVAWRIYGG